MLRSVATHIAVATRGLLTRKAFVASVIAVALIASFATRPSAWVDAVNPFLIDGVVTDLSNSKASGAAQKDTDPNSNAKELGPVQGTSTKFPVIHSAVPNMLGTSNPNPSTDLNTVYTQTEKDTSGASWFYFGWVRDSNSGSGFISFEAHQEPNTCAKNPDGSYTVAGLASCNPWSPRTVGDFVIFWDQSGSTDKVYLRVWNGSAFQPGQPGLDITDLVDTNDDPIVHAQYSADLFRGEMALNLTGAGLVGANECKAFANVIPGTITGNSQGDQADYKDVVLAPISINTCGGITVTKVTLDPSGAVKQDTTSAFPYTLKKGTTTVGDTTITGCTASAPCAGEVDTYSDLSAGSDYTLTEGTAPGDYVLKSIFCGATDLTLGGTFTLPESGTVACTITNQLPLGDSTLLTTPTVKALLYDSVTITLDNKIPDNTTITGVTFQLFPDNPGNQCKGTPVDVVRTRSVTFTNGLEGTTSTLPNTGADSIPNGAAFVVVSPGTYYWLVKYPGDTLNKASEICGEATTVSWSSVP